MAVATLRPSGDGTTTGWTRVPASSTFASKIVDDPDSNDADTSYVLSPNASSGTMFVQLDDVPVDFDPVAINSITIKVSHRRLNTPNMAVDLGTVNAFLTRLDEATAISTTPTEVSSPIQAGYALTSFTPSPTGTHTVAEWNGAKLALVFTHTNSQSADSVNQTRITAAEVLVDYTPAVSEVTGTGDLASAVSAVAGSGASSSTGTGAQAAQAAAVAGTGVSESTGTGTLSAGVSTVEGADSSEITGTGDLVAGSVTIDGEGVSASSGTGVLSGQASTLEGSGTSASSGSGALLVTQVAVAGAGISSSSGSGELLCGASTVSGADSEGEIDTECPVHHKAKGAFVIGNMTLH